MDSNPPVANMPSVSWLWQNDLYADVTLHLCTTLSITAPAASNSTDHGHKSKHEALLGHESGDGARDAPSSPIANQGRRKAARLGDSNATAPERARIQQSSRDGSCPEGVDAIATGEDGTAHMMGIKFGATVGPSTDAAAGCVTDPAVVAANLANVPSAGAGEVRVSSADGGDAGRLDGGGCGHVGDSIDNGAGLANVGNSVGGASCIAASVVGVGVAGGGDDCGGRAANGDGGVIEGGCGSDEVAASPESPTDVGDIAASPAVSGGAICTGACAEGAAACDKAAGGVAFEAVDSCTGRTFNVHAVILTSCSQYFKTRLALHTGGVSPDGLMVRYADQALKCRPPCRSADDSIVPDGVATQPRALLVEYLEDGELEAMEAVLRFCYTGLLCDSGGDPAELPIVALLQMAALADRFGVCSCLARCLEELNKRRAAEFDVPTINAVLSLPKTSPGLGLLTATATERLLQLFGDVAAVCEDADKALGKAFRQLSLAGILLLLRSDTLRSPSENQVLLMADMWINWSAADTTPAQIRTIVEALRLCRLTHTYTFEVLPALKWLQLTSDEATFLMKYAAAGVPLRNVYAQEGRLFGFPIAWYFASSRTLPSPPRVVTLTVTKAQLAAEASQAPETHGTTVPPFPEVDYCNGPFVHLHLHLARNGRPMLTLSLHLLVAGRNADGGEDPVEVRHGGAAVTVRYTIPCNGRRPAGQGVWKGVVSARGVFLTKLIDIPSAAGLDVVACWAPYLITDRFSIQCEVTVD